MFPRRCCSTHQANRGRRIFGLAIGFTLMASLAGVAGEHRGAPGVVKPAAQATSKGAPTAARISPSQNYGKLPLAFEANQGQTDPHVKYFSRGKGYALFLSGDEAVLSLRAGSQQSKVKGQKAKAEDDLELLGAPSASPAPSTQHPEPAVLRLKLAGAEAGARVTGLDELPGKSNYFIGNDPKKWRSNVPNYGKVKYEGVYPGIDLVYYGNQRQLEYDFVVAPGADPANIKFTTAGTENVSVDARGDLVLRVEGGEVRFHKPVVYQEESGVRSQESGGRRPAAENLQSSLGDRQPVDGRFLLLAGNRVGFEVGAYDKSKPLVIDPVLSYATFLGGTSLDVATGIAVDGSGNAYITGVTYSSSDFPATSGVYQTSFKGGTYDAFVTKLNATGSAVVYSTYLGGSSDDEAFSIAVDGSGNAYIAGETTSIDFPFTPGAFQTECRVTTTCDDVFVTKLSPDGATLVYSTYFGGTRAEWASRVVLDDSNNVYIAGVTNSTDILPTPPTSFTPYQATNKGGKDAFLAQLNNTGTTLLYFTYLGGGGNDQALDLVVKPGTTTAFLTGSTQSTDFPVWPLPGAYQTALKGTGTEDAFVTAIDVSQPPTSALVFSTYLGGTGDDSAAGIALDSSGDVYVAGTTDSTDLPTVNATQTTYGGGLDDIFVAELDPTGGTLYFSTYLGGSLDDQGSRVVVDASSNIFVGGFTDSVDFPTANPIQAANAGGYDVTLTEFSDGVLFFSTYLGGANDEVNVPNIGPLGGIALDSAGNLYATSYTGSNDFPVTPGSYQTTVPGSGDAFVVKIGPTDATTVILMPSTLNFGGQDLNVQSGNLFVTMRNMGSLALGALFINVQPDASTTGPTDFGQTNTCSSGVLGGGSCTFTVWFTPTALGSRTAVIKISEAPLGTNPRYISLNGTGVQLPQVSLDSNFLAFGDQIVGTTSGLQTITLTNTGAGPLTISNIATSAGFGAPLPNTPGPTACQLLVGQALAAAASCRIPVVFTPTGIGAVVGSLTITDDAPDSPQVVTLSGNGTAAPAIILRGIRWA
ncbi:MAG: SBBP repeat-containing protein [Terriglobia bacterium]